MEKIDKELIKEYREIKAEKDAQEKSLNSLQEDFVESEKYLSEADSKLREAEKSQQSSSLITIQDVQSAKRKTQEAKNEADDARCVCDNLGTAIKNALSTIQKNTTRETEVSRKIWKEYSQIMLADIEQEAGDKIKRYLAALVISHPGLTPHPLPGRLGSILNQSEELRELQNTIRGELFN